MHPNARLCSIAARAALTRTPAVAAALLLPLAVSAQSDEELQKKLANPVSDLITVPLQLTTTLHAGPFERPQHTLNIQPVYPMGLGGSWSLIHRLIVPLLSNPAAAPGQRPNTFTVDDALAKMGEAMAGSS
jgi:hypothetical protein